jgi:hypothetical protein
MFISAVPSRAGDQIYDLLTGEQAGGLRPCHLEAVSRGVKSVRHDAGRGC